MIQEIRIDKDNIHIGRFILDPRKTGFGLGTEAMKVFIKLIFRDKNIRSISLTVFNSNQRAKKLYDRLGFEIDETIEMPVLKYIMKKYR